MKPLGEPGVYDKVNSGRIVIKNKFGETEFGKGQAGFVGLRAQAAAVRLQKVPEFFKASRHENRIAKIKQRQHQLLDRGLIKKQQMLRQHQGEGKPNRPLPRLLNPNQPKRGFVPGTGADDKQPKKLPMDRMQPQRKIGPSTPIKRPPVPAPIRPLKSIPQPALPQNRIRPMESGKPALVTPGRLPAKALPAPAPIGKKPPVVAPVDDKKDEQIDEPVKAPTITPQLQPRQLQNNNDLPTDPIKTLKQPALRLPGS